MKTLKQDENNNIVIENGQPVFLYDGEACAQSIKNRIGLCIGENPFNINEGIDYFSDVLGSMGGKNFIEESIRNRILNDTDNEVISVESVELTKDNKNISLEAKIHTIWGVFEI